MCGLLLPVRSVRLELEICVVTPFVVGSESDDDLTMEIRVDRRLAEVGTVCRRGGCQLLC